MLAVALGELMMISASCDKINAFECRAGYD